MGSLKFKFGSDEKENRIKRNEDIGDKLYNNTAKNLTDEDKKNIKKYSDDSYPLNMDLINHKPLSYEHQKTHDTILKNVKPLGHEVHLYSGTRTDFGKMARSSKNGIIVSPAHLSTTHDHNVAKNFAGGNYGKDFDDEPKHLIHIHAKPTDKGLYIGKSNGAAGEYETILPAGTKLKYSHTTNHKLKTNPKGLITDFKVHHFTIDSQD
jgi:hypothetical protein